MKFNRSYIKVILQHRKPFLLIDSIDEISSDTIEASSRISKNNYILKGHFPGSPIVPGVLLVEIMAQAAGFLLAYNLIKENDGKLKSDDYDFFLSKVNSVRFKSKVIPPVTLKVKANIRPSLMENFCEANGQIYVNDELKTFGSVLLYMGLKNKNK